MDKKRIFLFSSILVLILIGLFVVYAAAPISSSGTSLNHTNLGAYMNANWSKGAANNATQSPNSMIVNFTINNSPSTMNSTIYSVNITIPAGWVIGYGGLDYRLIENWSTAVRFPNWTCMNKTARVIGCSGGGNGSKPFNYSGNGTNPFYLQVNLTALAGLESVYNFTVVTYDNDSGSSTIDYLQLGVDGVAPAASVVNITDGTNTVSSTFTNASSTLYNQTAINISITVTDYNLWKVFLVYNSSGGILNLTNLSDGSSIVTHGNASGGKELNGRVMVMDPSVAALPNGSLVGTTAPSRTYTTSLTANNFSASGTQFSFAFVVYDMFNNSKQVNNSNAPYVINPDGLAPAITMTVPASTTVATASSTGITYTCLGLDPWGVNSGEVQSYKWTLTKPSGTVEKTTATAVFKNSDIDQAGIYSAVCQVTDYAGRTTDSSTYQFTASITSSSSTSGGGGGGGGSAVTKTTVVVDQDLNTKVTAEVQKTQGAVVTFTVDGSTKHKMTFKAVSKDTVTLIIESTPIEVTLKVGEMKEVDVNGDGVNDLKVTLTAIEDGAAKVKTEKIVQAVPSTPTGGAVTGETTTTITGEGATTGVTVGKQKTTSLTWLWVVLVIIVIIVIVAIIRRKRR